MAKRDQIALGMERLLEQAAQGYRVPDEHPLADIKLMMVFIESSCDGLGPQDVDPDFVWDEVKDEHLRGQLISKGVETVDLYDYGHLIGKPPYTDELRGSAVLAFRGRFGQAADLPLEPVVACVDNMKPQFIQQLWDIFDKQINSKLPPDKRIAKPNPFPGSDKIFSGTTATSFTKYQDAQLRNLYRRLRVAAAKLKIELPDMIPPLSPPVPPQRQTSRKTVNAEPQANVPIDTFPAPVVDAIDEPTTKDLKVLEEDRVLRVLRDFVAESTGLLPPAFHSAALEPAAPPHRMPPPLHPLREGPKNIALPSSRFIVPSIRKITFTKESLAYLDEKNYQLDKLITMPNFVVVGEPGSGKSSLLNALAWHINTRPFGVAGPAMMVLVDAHEHAQSELQWLPMFAAIKLQNAGCLKDLGTTELVNHLERLSRNGRICWGMDQIDEPLESNIGAIASQLKLLNRYFVTVDAVSQPFVQKIQDVFGNRDNTFRIQPFDADRIRRYCATFDEMVYAGDPVLQDILLETDSDPGLPGTLFDKDRVHLSRPLDPAPTVDGYLPTRSLQLAISNPGLAAYPLGLNCICAVAGNFRRFLNPAQLFMAERFCRAAMEPDLGLLVSGATQSLTRALCDIAMGYWLTNRTLTPSVLMEQGQIEKWLAGSGSQANLSVLPSLLSARLVARSYDGKAFGFAQAEVYHLLLAVGYLSQAERSQHRLLSGGEVHRYLHDDSPQDLRGMMEGLADLRCQVNGVFEGDG